MFMKLTGITNRTKNLCDSLWNRLWQSQQNRMARPVCFQITRYAFAISHTQNACTQYATEYMNNPMHIPPTYMSINASTQFQTHERTNQRTNERTVQNRNTFHIYSATNLGFYAARVTHPNKMGGCIPLAYYAYVYSRA